MYPGDFNAALYTAMKFFVLTLSGRSKGKRDATGTPISFWK
jgi:hypothetical protein